MTSLTSIGINNDFSTGQTRICSRTTKDKSPCRIDEHLCVFSQKLMWNDFFNDMGHHIFSERCYIHIFRMLRGYNNGLDRQGLMLLTVSKGYLSFPVRLQIGKFTCLSDLSQLHTELM